LRKTGVVETIDLDCAKIHPSFACRDVGGRAEKEVHGRVSVGEEDGVTANVEIGTVTFAGIGSESTAWSIALNRIIESETMKMVSTLSLLREMGIHGPKRIVEDEMSRSLSSKQRSSKELCERGHCDKLFLWKSDIM
jgi:hypothetical protein